AQDLAQRLVPVVPETGLHLKIPARGVDDLTTGKLAPRSAGGRSRICKNSLRCASGPLHGTERKPARALAGEREERVRDRGATGGVGGHPHAGGLVAAGRE